MKFLPEPHFNFLFLILSNIKFCKLSALKEKHNNPHCFKIPLVSINALSKLNFLKL
jgi:hypothetical protein